MKQFYLLVLFTIMASFTFAQSIQISYQDSVLNNGDTVYVSGGATQVRTVDFNVKNTNSSSISVKVIKDELSLPNGMSYFFCFDVCYQPDQTTSAIVAIDANASYENPLECELLPSGNTGNALIKMVIKNTSSFSDSTIFYVNYSINVTGILSNCSSFNIYPNPVRNVLNIDTKNETKTSCEIYDELGAIVYSNSVTPKSIDVSNFVKGIYFVKLMSDNNLIGTQRIVVR